MEDFAGHNMGGSREYSDFNSMDIYHGGHLGSSDSNNTSKFSTHAEDNGELLDCPECGRDNCMCALEIGN